MHMDPGNLADGPLQMVEEATAPCQTLPLAQLDEIRVTGSDGRPCIVQSLGLENDDGQALSDFETAAYGHDGESWVAKISTLQVVGLQGAPS